MRDAKELDHTIQLARREINRQNAALALRYLDDIRSDIEGYPLTPLWAEHQVTVAEALAAMRDPVARSAARSEFEDAITRVTKLPERSLELELRAHEHFAMLLASSKLRSLARTHYEIAKKIAIEAGLREETARVQLSMIKNDFECDEDPRLASFKNLRNAAMNLGATAEQQLAAWLQFDGEAGQEPYTLVAARKGHAASVEFFERLLRSVQPTE